MSFIWQSVPPLSLSTSRHQGGVKIFKEELPYSSLQTCFVQLIHLSLSMIVWVNVILNRAVVIDSDHTQPTYEMTL